MSTADASPLMISIDLHLGPKYRSVSHQRQLNDFTRKILDSLRQSRISATFGIEDPAHSQLTELITRTGNHQLAILADASWAGPGVSQTVFGNELIRRTESARHLGFAVSSLFLNQQISDELLQTAVQSGIRSLRCKQDNSTTKQIIPGLVHVPVSLQYPTVNKWLSGLKTPTISANSTDNGLQPLHLLIDGEIVVQHGDMAITQVETLLRQCQTLKSRNEVRMTTLPEFTQSFLKKGQIASGAIAQRKVA